MNSKTILSPLLTIASALCLLAHPLLAGTFGLFTISENDTSITITDYPMEAKGAVVIPATIGKKPVTCIGYEAFNWCTGLTSVSIPNSVTSLKPAAFYRCSSLTSVSIPNRVKSIGKWAFQGCDKLSSVSIPNSVTSIGEAAFSECFRLTSVSIPNSVTSIGKNAFHGCSSLTGVSIGSGVKSIGVDAFDLCYGLTSAVFFGNAPTMGDSVFDNPGSGFTVYYQQGSTGFTTPFWHGYPTVMLASEIAVQQPVGTIIRDAGFKDFGSVAVEMRKSLTFTIRNTGNADLTGLAITKRGVNANDFRVSILTKTTIPPGSTANFKVTFKPAAKGLRKAIIRIKSNDADENPFDINLTGLGKAP